MEAFKAMEIRKTVTIVAAALSWIVLIREILTLTFGSLTWWVSLIIFNLCWLITRFMTRDIAETHSKYLDEYEIILKSQAFNFGFWTAIGLGAVLMIFLAIIGQSSGAWAHSILHSAWQLILGAYLLIAAAPTFYLGWTSRAVT